MSYKNYFTKPFAKMSTLQLSDYVGFDVNNQGPWHSGKYGGGIFEYNKNNGLSPKNIKQTLDHTPTFELPNKMEKVQSKSVNIGDLKNSVK